MSPEYPNARFWVYEAGGPVKLTMKPGQSLSWYRAGQHEEGWWSEGRTWTHEGDHVCLQSCDDGADCDGRLSRYYEGVCPLDSLQSVVPPVCDETLDWWHEQDDQAWLARERRTLEGVTWPDWQEKSRFQRDYAAEAMGY